MRLRETIADPNGNAPLGPDETAARYLIVLPVGGGLWTTCVCYFGHASYVFIRRPSLRVASRTSIGIFTPGRDGRQRLCRWPSPCDGKPALLSRH